MSILLRGRRGGLKWLGHWTPDRAVRVRALAETIALCSWTLLSQCLSPPPPGGGGGFGKFDARVKPAQDKHPFQGGVEIILVASCYKIRDKFQRYGPTQTTDLTCAHQFHLIA